MIIRMDPLRDQVTFSAETEQRFAEIVNQVERQKWLERNADTLLERGKLLAKTGLAGAEFERI